MPDMIFIMGVSFLCLLATGVAALATPGSLTAGPVRKSSRTGLEDVLRRSSPPQGNGAAPLVPPSFDAELQRVSITGDHAFIAPGPNDARGICPGLNAMANHGYLPRNGVATVSQFVQACQETFGMAPDLGLLLAAYGAVLDGSLDSWSIAGTPHTGIGGAHNNYESDSSPLKSDLHQYGSNGILVMEQFQALYDMQANPATANYNLEVLRDFRMHRFNESISKNPVFYYGPVSGQFVSQAAHSFMYRFMANKSETFPEGVLSREVLKSFSSIYGADDNLTWIPGHEHFPENFHRRHPADEYTILYFNEDVLYLTETEPIILLPGCNNGQVNSYDTIDPASLTNGAYTVSEVTKNPLCLSLAFLSAELPGLVGSTAQLTTLLNALANATSVLNCPPIESINNTALTVCPGFSLYGGPTGYVAAGAIRD